tara:strand:+ start:354 stop:1478 length:1125 start_codon:yes stop_codon:yes gene_type:complete
MKFLKKNKLILKNYLKVWNSNYLFTSSVNIFSLFINSLSIAVIILIFTINNGFKHNAVDLLNKISGNTKIYKTDQYSLTDDDYEKLQSNYKDLTLSRVVQNQCIFKNKGNSESVLLNSYDLNEKRYNDLNKFIYKGELTDSTLVIGKILAEKLNIIIDDSVSIIFIENDGNIRVKELKVSGLFSTDFLNFDSNIAINTISNNDKNYNYFTSSLGKSIYYDIIPNNYIVQDINDIHLQFLEWINTYDNPLDLLILFIIIICSINIINNNFYIVSSNLKQIFLLKTLGISNFELNIIFLLRALLFAFISFLIGGIFAYSILYLENLFNIVTIPEYVYFTKFVPITLDFRILYIIFPYFIILSILSLTLSYNYKNVK